MAKPRIAFFSFSCCEGCQLMVLNLEEDLLALAEHVDIVSFREAMTEHSDDYDIVFIEGSITTPSDLKQVKGLRERAKVVVALGACATMGGVNMMKNLIGVDKAKEIVYGDKAHYFESIPTMPIDQAVKVDYYIHGCPIDPDEFLEVTKSILIGRRPRIPNYPVCVECQMKENVCVFDVGKVCLGPITRAGCKAICPTYGHGCEGCRGLVDDPNASSHKNLLTEHGLTVEGAIGKYKMFGSGWKFVTETEK